MNGVLPVGVQIPFACRRLEGRLLADGEGWPVQGGCRLVAGSRRAVGRQDRKAGGESWAWAY